MRAYRRHAVGLRNDPWPGPAFVRHRARSRVRLQTAPARPAGFTLLELMVVMVVIGIVTAVILPEMKGTFEDALLRSTGRKLMDACNLAYSQAVTANRIHRIRFDLKKGRYAIERKGQRGEKSTGFLPVHQVPGAEGDLDPRIRLEFHRPDEDPAADGESPAASPEAEKSPGLGDVILFYPDGSADGGEIRLRDREGFALTLRINPTTARLEVVEKEAE